jgi:ABC-type molybdate transport system substrate-binding protein
VTAIDIPTSNQNRTSYWIAALAEAEEPSLGEAFVRLVRGATGRRVLADAGFGTP